MIDAKAMRDLSNQAHERLVNEDIVMLTQFVESEIDKAAQIGRYSISVNIEDYYEEAVAKVREKLESFGYETSLSAAVLCQPSCALKISW